jgi:hypothetical protein
MASHAIGLPGMFRLALEGELALARGRWGDAAAVADRMEVTARREWLALLPALTVMRDLIAATASIGLARGGDRAAARRARRLARAIGRRGQASFYAPIALRLEAQAEALLGDRRRAEARLADASRLAAARGGAVERAAIAALQERVAPPPALRAAVRWVTAGEVDA